MIIKFRYPAGPNATFDDTVAIGLVGQTFTAKVETAPIGKGKVIAAEIVDERRAIDLTVEWPD